MCAEASRPKERLVIRPFGKEDAEAASGILRESPEAVGWTAPMIRDLLATTGVSGFIATRDSRATGLILGREVLDEGEILNLAVAKGNRRQGEGTALSRQMMNSFATRGVRVPGSAGVQPGCDRFLREPRLSASGEEAGLLPATT